MCVCVRPGAEGQFTILGNAWCSPLRIRSIRMEKLTLFTVQYREKHTPSVWMIRGIPLSLSCHGKYGRFVSSTPLSGGIAPRVPVICYNELAGGPIDGLTLKGSCVYVCVFVSRDESISPMQLRNCSIVADAMLSRRGDSLACSSVWRKSYGASDCAFYFYFFFFIVALVSRRNRENELPFFRPALRIRNRVSSIYAPSFIGVWFISREMLMRRAGSRYCAFRI